MRRTSLERPFDQPMASRMIAEAKTISSQANPKSCLDYLKGGCFSSLERIETRYTNLSHQVQLVPDYDRDDELYAPAERVQQAFQKASTDFQGAVIQKAKNISAKATSDSQFVRLMNVPLLNRQFKSLDGIVNRVTDTTTVRDVLDVDDDEKKEERDDLPVRDSTLDTTAINRAYYQANIDLQKVNREWTELRTSIQETTDRLSLQAGEKLTSLSNKLAAASNSVTNKCTPRAAAAALALLTPIAYHFRSQLAEVFSPAAEFCNTAAETSLFGYNALVVGAATVASIAVLNLACCKR